MQASIAGRHCKGKAQSVGTWVHWSQAWHRLGMENLWSSGCCWKTALIIPDHWARNNDWGCWESNRIRKAAGSPSQAWIVEADRRTGREIALCWPALAWLPHKAAYRILACSLWLVNESVDCGTNYILSLQED